VKHAWRALWIALMVASCGPPSTPPQEESAAVWTSGDDEPLESPDEP